MSEQADIAARGSYTRPVSCTAGSCAEGCANNDPTKSAQPCGCDEGAHYTCVRHSAAGVVDKYITERYGPESETLDGLAADLNVSVKDLLDYAQESVDPVESFDLITKGPRVTPTRATTLPTDPAERKKYPIATGFMDYFPDAIAAIAHVSWVGNNQHNPGQPLHWARGKSMDQDDTTMRHMLERGGGSTSGFDADGQLHRAKQAWRTLAALQLEIEDLKARGLYPPKEGQ